MSVLFGLPPPLARSLAISMVAAVIALVAWALQLMQAASDRQEFSLMLAGCMVCSAAVGLSTVMVLTFTSPETFAPHPSAPSLETIKITRAVGLTTESSSLLPPWEAAISRGASAP